MIQKFMTSIFGASWRTSLMGLLGAIFRVAWPLIKNGTFNLHTDWPAIVEAGGIFIFGLMAKDKNVTGGNTVNNNDTTGVKVLLILFFCFISLSSFTLDKPCPKTGTGNARIQKLNLIPYN